MLQGKLGRMQKFLDKLHKGEETSVSFLGASVSTAYCLHETIGWVLCPRSLVVPHQTGMGAGSNPSAVTKLSLSNTSLPAKGVFYWPPARCLGAPLGLS